MRIAGVEPFDAREVVTDARALGGGLPEVQHGGEVGGRRSGDMKIIHAVIPPSGGTRLKQGAFPLPVLYHVRTSPHERKV
ncbi:hypothetical protein GCM10010347_55480 [Streptomyces cirratus]|uniref:Macro domain-containing protein n=1 Tax=Streptomyces cirratus TaxID=68187 RepID=A0ABQ3F3R6_9ACTN|nr:hypothetical protein GCM10010347_55480 [Streptomyces cirratus]